MLSDDADHDRGDEGVPGLNAPFGARCFLTLNARSAGRRFLRRLNAPFGARCFLTRKLTQEEVDLLVLMRLLALGAF